MDLKWFEKFCYNVLRDEAYTAKEISKMIKRTLPSTRRYLRMASSILESKRIGMYKYYILRKELLKEEE